MATSGLNKKKSQVANSNFSSKVSTTKQVASLKTPLSPGKTLGAGPPLTSRRTTQQS